jgi:choline dehydrogenase-like flavoprotein/predicted dehydrogenase
MRVFDLRYFGDLSPLESDLCIVGTGPAGLSIAGEFANAGVRVLLVESGGFEDETDTQALYEVESSGDPRTINQELIRRRILGGSSHVWSGRCAPFDPLDFEKRSWVPYSGWPVTGPEINPFLRRAAAYLGLGQYEYDESLWEKFKAPPPHPSLNAASFRPMFWQFSRSSFNVKQPAHFGRDRMSSDAPNVQVLLHANLTHINTSSDGSRFESAEVSTLDGKRILVNSKALVLCCGGVENARLLLASNRVLPHGVGNQNDLVGRFLMDHIDCPIGMYDSIAASETRSRFGHYWIDDEDGRHVYEHGLALSKRTQQEAQLLNCHGFILGLDPVSNDPWVALRRLTSARRPSNDMLSDSRTVLKGAAEIGQGLHRRYFKHRPQLEAQLRTELHIIFEQAPNPESRVTLSKEKRDALGMPISSLHWKITDLERRTAAQSSRLIFQELEQLGLPIPSPMVRPDEQSDWISHCAEKAHPTGTTRMSDNAQEGVVDRHCQVHGVKGLFVAGSSVFPTAGAANPTLMIVAMALRLADRLKTTYFKSSEQAHDLTPPTLHDRFKAALQNVPPPGERLKVGLIGAGKRIYELYLPTLQQLSQHYEVVGVTSRSLESSQRLESKTGIRSFRDAQHLVEQKRPGLLVVAISDTGNEAAIAQLLDLGVPILSETPLAWSAAGVRGLIGKAAANKVMLGVAEQFPFLPLEQFRRQLIDLGVFGSIYAAFNDFHSYSYHGIAQLRRYLGGVPTSVRNVEYAQGSDIRWQSGSVTFSDGATLLHHWALSGASFQPGVRFQGTRGAMVNHQITTMNDDEISTSTAVREVGHPGNLKSISTVLPKVGRVTWSNPFSECNFSDEQIAVATVLQAMAKGIAEATRPIYSAEDFLADIEIVQALRYSAEAGGRTILLPLKEAAEKARRLASPGFWKRKIFNRRGAA